MKETFVIDCAGYSIAADWYTGSAEKIAIFLMGFTSTRSRQEDLIRAIVASTGMSALVIDYAGHGDSPFDLKDIRPAQHLLEVIYTFDWVTKQYPDADISVVSSSYGGYLATQLTQYRQFKNLILRAPAIYRPETLYDPWNKRFSDETAYRDEIMAYRNNRDLLVLHPALTNAKNFQGNTLVVTHENDEIIPKLTTDVYAETFTADTYIARKFAHAVSQSPLTEHEIAEYQAYMSQWLNNQG